jgi:hypothetical protein
MTLIYSQMAISGKSGSALEGTHTLACDAKRQVSNKCLRLTKHRAARSNWSVTMFMGKPRQLAAFERAASLK